MVDFRVSVVLPAGGSGSRMGINLPKQYCRIMGRPLISYTIEAFESISWIEHVVVAGPVTEDQTKLLKNILVEFNHKKVITTNGASTRHRSIFNGIQCLNTYDQKPDVVVIHDAVRPFIEEELLKDIVLAAQNHGTCGVVRPLVSTVLARKQDGFLDHSLDRSKYIGSEMPQAFQYDIILNAYQKCTEHDLDYGTECLHLALKYSQTNAFLIDGPDYLWKVTHKKDLYAAEGVVKERLRQYAKFSGNSSESALEEATGKKLKARGVEVRDENLSKINILVNVRLLNQDKFKDSCFDKIMDELTLELDNIEQNGILVIVRSGREKDLAELTIATRHIAREGKERQITCCAVWCENFATSLTAQEKTTSDKLDNIAEMIVCVALETPPSFSGQVFTVLDTT